MVPSGYSTKSKAIMNYATCFIFNPMRVQKFSKPFDFKHMAVPAMAD